MRALIRATVAVLASSGIVRGVRAKAGAANSAWYTY